MRVLVMILFSLMLISCAENKKITKEDCEKIGKTYKNKRILNFGTGLYEERSECI